MLVLADVNVFSKDSLVDKLILLYIDFVSVTLCTIFCFIADDQHISELVLRVIVRR